MGSAFQLRKAKCHRVFLVVGGIDHGYISDFLPSPTIAIKAVGTRHVHSLRKEIVRVCACNMPFRFGPCVTKQTLVPVWSSVCHAVWFPD